MEDRKQNYLFFFSQGFHVWITAAILLGRFASILSTFLIAFSALVSRGFFSSVTGPPEASVAPSGETLLGP